MKPYSFAKLLYAFFHEWMGQQRNLSRHTVLSYRDTWKLLLRFVSERKRRAITALSLSDLEAAEVLGFLQYLENDRKVSIGNRNCRLGCHPQLLRLCRTCREVIWGGEVGTRERYSRTTGDRAVR